MMLKKMEAQSALAAAALALDEDRLSESEGHIKGALEAVRRLREDRERAQAESVEVSP